jgi:hypothetical protein
VDRALVARVLKHMRSLGWGPTTYGWADKDETVFVDVHAVWFGSQQAYDLVVRRRDEHGQRRQDATAIVRNERIAVDVLCALGVLPAHLSSMWLEAFRLGMSGSQEFGPPQVMEWRDSPEPAPVDDAPHPRRPIINQMLDEVTTDV